MADTRDIIERLNGLLVYSIHFGSDDHEDTINDTITALKAKDAEIDELKQSYESLYSDYLEAT